MKANHRPLMIDLHNDTVRALDVLRREKGCTRIRLIRDAISDFLFAHSRQPTGGRFS